MRYNVQRFIPACAGNAWGFMIPACWPPVHPRMRGERDEAWLMLGHDAGSSPHARGTPMKYGLLFIFNRFIPACAGNACEAQAGGHHLTVHPRMRGERLGSYLSTIS